MNDQNWLWWQQALENPRDIGKRLTMTTTPEQGFYRTRYKNGPWEAVAIWKADGQWVALRGGQPVKDVESLWTWSCRNPVSAEAYNRALAGYGWADDEPTVTAMRGHNIGEDDDLAALRDQIDAAQVGAEAYADIQSDEEAGKAQSLRARMNELAGEADKKRESLKRPHLEAGKAIDHDWMPLVKAAKAVADKLKYCIASYETAKLRERRRLEEERQRLERERLEAEQRALEEARKAEAAGLTPVVPPAPAPLPPPLPPQETTIKGSYGRAANVGVRKVVIGIDNLDLLLMHYRMEDKLWKFLMELAQKSVDAGFNVPGVVVEERAKIS